ncbi:MAG: hypothetical protein C7B46_02975 [Sulfobacillus benefaciens]|uniref:histidine kinase n=1 Tax=Sulfobacillus benefaciens TaxID=453960 RepID=A0A2T2XK68_9FIRM|nr:MAG: hypothetical protein C7B46_02975 [Sulfobacillus benefaciens]
MIKSTWVWIFDSLVGIAIVVNYIVLVQRTTVSATVQMAIVVTSGLYFVSLLTLRLRSPRWTGFSLLGMAIFTTILILLLSHSFSFLVFVDLGVLGLRLTSPWLERLSLPLVLWVFWLLYPNPASVTWLSTTSAFIAAAGSFGIGWMLRFMQEANTRQLELVAQLSRANEELASSSLRDRQLAMLEERTRIARDLHDTLGNALTAITLQLEAVTHLIRSQQPEEALGSLTETKELSRDAMRQLRASLTELRRPLISLERELQGLLVKAQDRQNWKTEWHGHMNDASSLSTELSYAILRIGQELLTNVERHARASTVNVTLYGTHDYVNLSISDDGRGFDPDHIPPGHFGLSGIHERVALLGGSLRIISGHKNGTQVTVFLPVTAGNDKEGSVPL